MVKEQTPIQSSGKSQNQSAETMQKRIQELESELNYLNYQNSLNDQKSFRDILLRQMQIMNQNLLGIKEEIVKASGEESSSEDDTEDNRLNEKGKSSYDERGKSSYNAKTVRDDDEESDEDSEPEDDDDNIEFEDTPRRKK